MLKRFRLKIYIFKFRLTNAVIKIHPNIPDVILNKVVAQFSLSGKTKAGSAIIGTNYSFYTI